MDNAKILELVDRTEADLRELAKLTGEDCINTYIINGAFSLESFTNANGQRILSFYREANNE